MLSDAGNPQTVALVRVLPDGTMEKKPIAISTLIKITFGKLKEKDYDKEAAKCNMDLTGFVKIPYFKGYYLSRDGRVYSARRDRMMNFRNCRSRVGTEKEDPARLHINLTCHDMEKNEYVFSKLRMTSFKARDIYMLTFYPEHRDDYFNGRLFIKFHQDAEGNYAFDNHSLFRFDIE